MWLRVETEDYNPTRIVHTLPDDEQDRHDMIMCECGPEIEQLSCGGFLVKHRSYDRRELFEKEQVLMN